MKYVENLKHIPTDLVVKTRSPIMTALLNDALFLLLNLMFDSKSFDVAFVGYEVSPMVSNFTYLFTKIESVLPLFTFCFSSSSVFYKLSKTAPIYELRLLRCYLTVGRALLLTDSGA